MRRVDEGYLTRAEMEARRFRAAALLGIGFTPAFVAWKFGVSRQTASRWWDLSFVVEGLTARPSTGRPPKLSGEQLRSLYSLWETRSRWTCKEFAEAIRVATGVTYDPDHVSRLILRLGLWEKRQAKAPVPQQMELAHG